MQENAGGRDEDEAHAQAEENFREKRANGRDHRAEDDGAIMKSNKDDGVKFYTYAKKMCTNTIGMRSLKV